MQAVVWSHAIQGSVCNFLILTLHLSYSHVSPGSIQNILVALLCHGFPFFLDSPFLSKHGSWWLGSRLLSDSFFFFFFNQNSFSNINQTNLIFFILSPNSLRREQHQCTGEEGTYLFHLLSLVTFNLWQHIDRAGTGAFNHCE